MRFAREPDGLEPGRWTLVGRTVMRSAALAQSLGIEPTPDRGRFIYEVTRLLYNTPEGRKPSKRFKRGSASSKTCSGIR